MRPLLALVVALAAVGCYHDKYNTSGPKREDYQIPPDEPRFNEPETAIYRPPPAPKQQETLTNRGGGNTPMGNKTGGF